MVVVQGKRGADLMRSAAVNHTSPRQPARSRPVRSHSIPESRNIPSTATGSREQHRHYNTSFSEAMVKLGANLSDKLDKQPSVDDGFDNIPLITPLEVNQLKHTFTDKVIVKTSSHFQLQQKKSRFIPSIKRLNIHFYRDVSDKVKITGLILMTLAFLTSLLLLLMYKEMWYDQLTCPEGFILKEKHCSPAALEMYYSEQQQQDPSSATSKDQTGLLSALNQLKRTEPSSPWRPVLSALKEAQSKQALQNPLDQDK